MSVSLNAVDNVSFDSSCGVTEFLNYRAGRWKIGQACTSLRTSELSAWVWCTCMRYVLYLFLCIFCYFLSCFFETIAWWLICFQLASTTINYCKNNYWGITCERLSVLSRSFNRSCINHMPWNIPHLSFYFFILILFILLYNQNIYCNNIYYCTLKIINIQISSWLRGVHQSDPE